MFVTSRLMLCQSCYVCVSHVMCCDSGITLLVSGFYGVLYIAFLRLVESESKMVEIYGNKFRLHFLLTSTFLLLVNLRPCSRSCLSAVVYL